MTPIPTLMSGPIDIVSRYSAKAMKMTEYR